MAKRKVILLFLILAIASFFRLWQLNEIPPGLYPDVAINGNDALESLKKSDFRVFYPENNGREGLFIWLIAFSFSIFGVSIWSIKIVAAIFGILTVLGLYLLTKEIFQNTKYKIIDTEYIALLSSFFLAISFWHTNFSRIGFRAILLPFILVFAFYFLFKGLDHLKRQNYITLYSSILFIGAGVIFGLGFYTYTSFRVAVLILPFILFPYWFFYKKQSLQKILLIHTLLFLILIFIVVLPLGIYFLKNPQDFISRAAPISIFRAENPIKEFGKSLVFHFGMFNIYGDPNWRHNFAGSPQLFWPIGILFLIGIIFSFKELIRSLKLKDWSLGIGHWLLIGWFFIMLLPGILTREGIPHALRVIGAIPAVYIFAGLGGWWSYQKSKNLVKNQKLLFALCSLFFVLVGLSEFNKYFLFWAKNPNVEGAFTKKFVEMGYFLNSLPKDYQKYVIVNEPGVPVPWPDGIPMPAQTIMFIENSKFGKIQSTYLLPENLDKIKIEKKGVILPMKYEDHLFNRLKQKFPQGQIKEKEGIWIYEIK